MKFNLMYLGCFQNHPVLFSLDIFFSVFPPVFKTFAAALSLPPPPLVVLLRNVPRKGPPSPSVLFRIMLRQSFLSLCVAHRRRERERERERGVNVRREAAEKEGHHTIVDDMSRNKAFNL